MPFEFNRFEIRFIPKHVAPGTVEIVAAPNEVRCLGLENCDNKIVSGITNDAVSKVNASHICPIQRGFVRGRQLLQNVVDLDGEARLCGPEQRGDAPLLGCFDIAAAFPSLVHAWMWLVFSAVDLPSGVLNIIKGIYLMNIASSNSFILFIVRAGVLQGCPLSGSIFALCTHPFYSYFKAEIDDKGLGMTRCCADDVGAVILKLIALVRYAVGFIAMRDFGGLSVSTRKCFFVPLAAPFSSGLVAVLRERIEALEIFWVGVPVVKMAKYLGFWLGPAAGKRSWDDPSCSWESRTKTIANASASASVSVLGHNSRALPVTQYVAQLLPPPEELLKKEVWATNKLLHLPPRTFPASLGTSLSLIGGKNISTIRSASLAAMIRTARKTVDWQDVQSKLEQSADERRISVEKQLADSWCATHWEGEAMCTYLCRVFNGKNPTSGTHDVMIAEAMQIPMSDAHL